MPPRYEPWISRQEYSAFQKLAPSDTALPATYEEWYERINDRISVFLKSGIPVEKVDINPSEFEAYCKANNINPDSVARAAFVITKIK